MLSCVKRGSGHIAVKSGRHRDDDSIDIATLEEFARAACYFKSMFIRDRSCGLNIVVRDRDEGSRSSPGQEALDVLASDCSNTDDAETKRACFCSHDCFLQSAASTAAVTEIGDRS